jgi:membrane protease YdiL (CAAX protease family)
MSQPESIEEYIESLRPLPIAHLEWMAEHIDKEKFPDRYKAIVDAISEKRLDAPQAKRDPSERKILRTMDLLSMVYLVLAIFGGIGFLGGMMHGKDIAWLGSVLINILMYVSMYTGFRLRKGWVIPLLCVLLAFLCLELLVEKEFLHSVGRIIGKSLRGLFYCYQVYFFTKKGAREVLGIRGSLFRLESLRNLNRVARQEVSWPLRDVILGCAIVVAIWVLPHVYVIKPEPWRWYLFGFASLMAVDVILLVYSLSVFWRRGIWPLFKLSTQSNLLKNSVKWALVGLAIQVVAILIVALIGAIFNIQPEEDLLSQWATTTPTNLWIVLTVVLSFTFGPVAEEVFFRGFVYSWLRTRIPILLAMGIQAVFFSVIHGNGLLFSIIIFLMGIALAAIYEKRGELVTPIVVHSAINAMVAIPVFALMIQNYHAPAKDWMEALHRPSWFLETPSGEIEHQSDGMKQWQYAIDEWGSNGSRQWKKEANAFQAVCFWFPNDRLACSKARLGIVTVYVHYLGDYRRGILEADELLLDYPDQREQSALTLCRMGRAYLMLKDFKKSRESFKRVLNEFPEVKEAAESAREEMKWLNALNKGG